MPRRPCIKGSNGVNGVAAALRCRMPGDDQFERMAETVEQAGPIGALRQLVDWEPSPASSAAVDTASNPM